MPLSTRRLSVRAAPAVALIAAIAAFAACNPGSSNTTPSIAIPSIEIPSVALPSVELPSGLGGSFAVTGSGVVGCVDPATFAILNQLTAQGADLPTLIQQNKDALIKGLGSFTPGDQNTKTWRDNLVFAIQAGDFTTAAAQLQMMAQGQVSISSC